MCMKLLVRRGTSWHKDVNCDRQRLKLLSWGKSVGKPRCFSPTRRHGEARSSQRAGVCMCSMSVWFVCVHACAAFVMPLGV